MEILEVVEQKTTQEYETSLRNASSSGAGLLLLLPLLESTELAKFERGKVKVGAQCWQ